MSCTTIQGAPKKVVNGNVLSSKSLTNWHEIDKTYFWTEATNMENRFLRSIWTFEKILVKLKLTVTCTRISALWPKISWNLPILLPVLFTYFSKYSIQCVPWWHTKMTILFLQHFRNTLTSLSTFKAEVVPIFRRGQYPNLYFKTLQKMWKSSPSLVKRVFFLRVAMRKQIRNSL